MSKYLARLKALDLVKPLVGETAKAPFVGFDGGVGEGFQKSRGPFDGFDGFQGRGFSETQPADEDLKTPMGVTVKTDKTSWHVRAAALEATGLPREWAEPFVKISCGPPPGDVDQAYWARVLPGASLFADERAAQARQLGWTAEDVFGLDDLKPASRHDRNGVAWLLGYDARIIALDERSANIVTRQRSKQRFYRSPAVARGEHTPRYIKRSNP